MAVIPKLQPIFTKDFPYEVQDWLRQVYIILGNGFKPGNAAKVQQQISIFAGNGVPSNSDGSNGDFYFRGDGAAGSFIYNKAAGVWAAFV